MPSCAKGVCPGHKEDDLLPFTHLSDEHPEPYSNMEFYQLLDPRNTNLPYVYDALDHWVGCTGSSMWEEYKENVK